MGEMHKIYMHICQIFIRATQMCKDTNKKTRTLQNIHLNLGKDTNENGVHTGLTSLIAPVYNFLDLSTGIVSRYLT